MELIIGSVITIVVSIVGWIIATKNVKSEFDRSIQLQNDSKVRNLKIDSAHDSIKKIETVRTEVSKCMTYFTSIVTEYKIMYPKLNCTNWEQNPSIILLKKYEYIGDLFAEYAFFFESREVILHDYKCMHTEISTEFNKYFELLIEIVEETRNIYFNNYVGRSQKDEHTDKVLEALEDRLREATFDIIAFSYDCIIELQNHYLGDIFEYQIPYRKPEDTSMKVLKIDDLKT